MYVRQPPGSENIAGNLPFQSCLLPADRQLQQQMTPDYPGP